MKTETEYQVKMVETNPDSITRRYKQTIIKFDKLGKELKISPKTCVTVNKPGFIQQMFVESVTVNIGIGKDNSADLVMTKEAWEAFKNGEEIEITTVKEFKEKFL